MILEIQNLTKSYGKHMALNQVSLSLTPGVYALLGPNGAGKSTLMNLIAGNIRQDYGKICYDGKTTEALGREFRRILGFMPQQQGLYENFTAYRFLSYMASLKGMSRAEAAKEIEWALEMVHLADNRNQRLGAFSGGMKQRVLMAQAIMNDPEILILDEPTAGLDPKERIRIRNIISEIAMDKIVIFATHVVSDIEQIAKEAVMLKAGKIAAVNTPEALCDMLEGKVFEAEMSQGELERLENQLLIRNLVKRDGRLIVRFLSETPLVGVYSSAVRADLEDVYLYYFANGKGAMA